MNAYLIAPRVGYAYLFTPMVGIWPRGGITFIGASGENGSGSVETSQSMLAISLEAPLVITPVPHAGFTLAGTFDIGITGSEETTVRDEATGTEISQETDVTGSDFGLQAGLFLYF
jgi:hypothetical protein